MKALKKCKPLDIKRIVYYVAIAVERGDYCAKLRRLSHRNKAEVDNLRVCQK